MKRLKRVPALSKILKQALWVVLWVYPFSARCDLFVKQDSSALWSRYYTDTQSLPLDSVRDVTSLMKNVPENCTPYTKRILDLVDDYGKSAAESNSLHWDHVGPAAIGKKIDSLLSNELGESHPCFDSVAHAYILGSLGLLDSGRYLDLLNYKDSPYGATQTGAQGKEGDILVTQKTHSRRTGQYVDTNGATQSQLIPTNLEHTLIALLLSNRGKIALLSNVARTSLGGDWTQKTTSGEYEILGGYDCNLGVIWIDPHRMPIDVASILVHEMDHLFRDKFTTLDQIKKEFSSTQNSKDLWSSYILMDEAIAIMNAGYYVSELKSATQRIVPGTAWPFEEAFPSKYMKGVYPYQLDNDAVFAGTTGPLNHIRTTIFETEAVDAPVLLAFSLLQGSRDVFSLTGVNSNYDFRIFDFVNKRNLSWIQKLYLQVWDVYFPTDVMNAAITKNLDPTLHTFALDPFSILTETPSQLNQRYWSVEFNNGMIGPIAPILLRGNNGPFQVDSFLRSLLSLDQKLDSISDSCKAYDTAVTEGDLGNYVGAKLGSKTKPGDTGVKPGDTGVKPAVRPCLSVKTDL